MKLSNQEILEKYKDRTFKTMTLAEQKEYVVCIPWVRALKESVPCDGFLARTAIKHIFGTPEQQARKPKCKFKAWWHFTGSKAQYGGGRTGNYCWNHLWCRGIQGGMEEDVRYERWLIRVGLMEKGNGRGQR